MNENDALSYSLQCNVIRVRGPVPIIQKLGELYQK